MHCDACTNPAYFNCTESGKCLHPELECDGHPQCPHGEDEKLETCHQKYIDGKIVSLFASYRCKSIFYENMWIYATPCDRIIECFDHSDEKHCDQDKKTSYILFGSSFVIIFIYIGLKLFDNHNQKNTDFLLFESSIDYNPIEQYECNHTDPKVIESVNVYLIRKILTNREDITDIISKQFYDLEWRVHKGVQSEMYWCLHRNLNPLVVERLVDSKFPGIMSRLLNFCFLRIKNKIKQSEKVASSMAVMKRILAIELKYLDQFKDIALTFWILELIGGYPSLFHLPSNFTSVIGFSMIFSISMPLLLSGLHLAANNPYILWKSFFRSDSYVSKRIMEMTCVGMSFLNPVLLANAFEQAKESTRKLAKFCDYGIIDGMKNCRRLKMQLVKYHRIELGTETFVQVILQALILLLSTTSSATTGGLDTIFNEESLGLHPVTFLSLSITWSLFSFAKAHTTSIAAEKGYCQMSSKIFIFSWGTFATLRRVLSIIAFFIPSMGLFSILHHWKAEQIPYSVRKVVKRTFRNESEPGPDDKIGLYGFNETIFWSELDRWNYSDPFNPTPPSYTLYTILSLKKTFLTALILSLFQFILIYLVKNYTSGDFKAEPHFINKTIHVLDNLHFATPFKDWDDGDYTIEDFKKRFKNLKKEMLATFSINFCFSLTMLVPLWYCGRFHKIFSL